MKKIIFIIFIFVGLGFGFVALAAEKIDNFEAIIKINPDSTLNISERIEYNFGYESKHGTQRDIPVKYKTSAGNFNLRLSDISVIDENANNYKFSVFSSGNNLRIKIGDADKFVTGQKIYIISYKISRAINYFSSHDELYWNVTGFDWQIPIEKSFAKIILPQPIKITDLKIDCFAGETGSQNPCLLYQYNKSDNENVSEIIFEQSQPLLPGQNLTVVVGVPKGLIIQPTKTDNFIYFIKDNLIIFLPIIVFLAMFFVWFRFGRDPGGRGTIIAQYGAPDNLTAAQTGVLIDGRLDPKDISSEIVYLATKGYLKITRTENKGIIFKHEDYLLEKLKSPEDLPPYDKRLMDGLFSFQGNSVKLSDLKNKFFKELPDIKKQFFTSVLSEGYFPKNPETVKVQYVLIGVGISILCLILSSIINQYLGVAAFLSIVASGIIVILFGLAMPTRTKKGAETKERILGLKEYLGIAEKDRIKFHNAPEKNPQHFEKLLPFAMVLGVEREWAKQFEGIYNQPPSWYSDPAGGHFNSLVLIHSLNNFSHSAQGSLVSPPAARGGSGIGGGGFSGGGFGGGGGGSW